MYRHASIGVHFDDTAFIANLKSLALNTHYDGMIPIRAPHLTKLVLSGMSKPPDLAAFDNIRCLPPRLKIFTAYRSKMPSFHMLSSLQSLTSIHLAALPNLTTEGLAGLELLPSLRKLHLHSCPRVTDLCRFTRSPSLRFIELIHMHLPQGLLGFETIPTLRQVVICDLTPAANNVGNLLLSDSLEELTVDYRWRKAIACRGPISARSLRRLSLRGSDFAGPFVRAPQLSSLSLTRVTFVSPVEELQLQNLTSLTELHVTCNKALTTVNPFLTSFSTIQRLDLTAMTALTTDGLQEVWRLPRLEYLDLTLAIRVKDFRFLSACPVLRVLLMPFTVTDDTLEGLESILTLEELFLKGSNVTNANRFQHLPHLRKIDLGRSRVSDAGIAGLSSAPSLEWISLKQCCSVRDVRPLTRCRTLKVLHLRGSGVTEDGIEGVPSMATLELLTLYGTKVDQWRKAEASVTQRRNERLKRDRFLKEAADR